MRHTEVEARMQGIAGRALIGCELHTYLWQLCVMRRERHGVGICADQCCRQCGANKRKTGRSEHPQLPHLIIARNGSGRQGDRQGGRCPFASCRPHAPVLLIVLVTPPRGKNEPRKNYQGCIGPYNPDSRCYDGTTTTSPWNRNRYRRRPIKGPSSCCQCSMKMGLPYTIAPVGHDVASP